MQPGSPNGEEGAQVLWSHSEGTPDLKEVIAVLRHLRISGSYSNESWKENSRGNSICRGPEAR